MKDFKKIIFSAFFAFGLTTPLLVLAQDLDTTDFKQGVVYLPGSDTKAAVPAGQVDEIFKFLDPQKNPNLQSAVSQFFDQDNQDLYNWKLPDWVIYINQDGAVTQHIVGSKADKKDAIVDLFQNGKDYVADSGVGQKMYEKRHIFAFVIADFPQYPDANGNTSNVQVPLTISHTVLGRYCSATDTLLSALAVSKVGAAETIISTSNETVTVNAYPAYDFSVLLAKADISNTLGGLEDLDGLLKKLDKVTPDKAPLSELDEMQILRKLSGYSDQLRSPAELDLLAALEADLKRATRSSGEFLTNLSDLKNKDQDTPWRVKRVLDELAGLNYSKSNPLNPATFRKLAKAVEDDLGKYEKVQLNKIEHSLAPKDKEGNTVYEYQDKLDYGKVKKDVEADIQAHHWFLYVGLARINLTGNTVNRCTLTLPNQVASYFNKQHPSMVGTTFGNTDKDFGSVSLSLVDSNIGGWPNLRYPTPDIFILGHFFIPGIAQPEKPWSNESFSFCFGPELNLSTPFSQFITALDFGPGGNSGLGFLLGCRWYSSFGFYQPSWVYGINYFL